MRMGRRRGVGGCGSGAAQGCVWYRKGDKGRWWSDPPKGKKERKGDGDGVMVNHRVVGKVRGRVLIQACEGLCSWTIVNAEGFRAVADTFYAEL